MNRVYCDHDWQGPYHQCDLGCAILHFVLPYKLDMKRLKGYWWKECKRCNTLIKLETPEDFNKDNPKIIIGWEEVS